MYNTLALFALFSIASATGECSSGSGAGRGCELSSGGDVSIGTCTNTTCNKIDCAVDGKMCGTVANFKGVCVASDGSTNSSCVFGVLDGKCAKANLEGTYCKTGLLVGQCDNNGTSRICAKIACETDSVGETCGDTRGGNFLGFCNANKDCVYTTAKCDVADDMCMDGNLIGTCNDSSTKLCVTENQMCGVTDGEPCGSTSTPGRCVKSKKTCVKASAIAAGHCAEGNVAATNCKNGKYVGLCNGSENGDGQKACTTTVNTVCKTAKGTTCGAHSFMGFCEETNGKCMYTTKCDGAGSPCKSGNLIGVCNSGSNKVCNTQSDCTEDGAACGGGTGRCVADDKTCVDATTIGAGYCAPHNISTTYCKSGKLVGKCEGSDSNPCNAVNCSSKSAEDTCGGGDFKGFCDAAGVKGACLYTSKCMQNDSDKTYCKSGSLIGMCNGDSSTTSSNVCVTSGQCSNKLADQHCGHATDINLKGYCDAAKGSCMMGNAVKIGYKIQKKPADLSTHEERQDLATKITGAGFIDDLTARMSLVVADNMVPCPVESPIVTNSDAAFATCLAASNSESAICSLTCMSTYHVKREHARKCIAGEWQGLAGECAKRCDGGTSSANMVTFTGTALEGTLQCKGASSFPKVADSPDSFCTVTCQNGYRVATTGKHMCKADRTGWTGGKGSCELAADLVASAIIVLSDDHDHAKITHKQDEIFNDKFKESVAALLEGVSKEHIIINTIMSATTGGSRRLNEKSVQVNYTVRAGKAATELNKVDGTHSPEGDGRLLRGIQEGLRGIQ